MRSGNPSPFAGRRNLLPGVPWRRRMSSPIRSRRRSPGSRRRSTGTQRSRTAGTCGPGAWGSPKRWTRRSAACASIEKLGGRIILMASRALVACAKSPEDYARVYDRILSQVKEPVIIHWLGEMFDPALEGYWGRKDHYAAMDVCLAVLKKNQGKVDGIKISLLDKDKEIAMRRKLPRGVRMYTGDDFNFAELIEGDAEGYSDALLGIFDAIAPAASHALSALAINKRDEYHEVLAPTVPLSRHIFRAPTRFYKTGVVFMAWLNGHQDHFVMVGGQQSARHLLHFCELFRLADAAGLLSDPPLACARMKQLLAVHGCG